MCTLILLSYGPWLFSSGCLGDVTERSWRYISQRNWGTRLLRNLTQVVCFMGLFNRLWKKYNEGSVSWVLEVQLWPLVVRLWMLWHHHHHHHHIHFRALFSSTEGWALHPMISLACQIFSVQPHSACVLLQSSLCCALHVQTISSYWCRAPHLSPGCQALWEGSLS